MAERYEHIIDGVFHTESETGEAFAHHVGYIDDGKKMAFHVNASDEEAVVKMRRGLEDTFRVKPGSSEFVNTGDGRDSSFFGFSSSNWKAPWEPAGPKPNWKVGPPKDPRAN